MLGHISYRSHISYKTDIRQYKPVVGKRNKDAIYHCVMDYKRKMFEMFISFTL